MRYRVEIKESAQRQLGALPGAVRQRIWAAIEGLGGNPRPPGVRKIVGGANAYRVRVGDYRVVYEIIDRVLTVYVVRVAHRKDVYRGL